MNCSVKSGQLKHVSSDTYSTTGCVAESAVGLRRLVGISRCNLHHMTSSCRVPTSRSLHSRRAVPSVVVFAIALVTGFSTVECQAPCSPQWTVYNSTNSYGGTYYPSATTVGDCLNLCASMPSCLAVDINTYNPQNPAACYVHTVEANIKQKNSNMNGITQYVITRRCLADSSLSNAATSTSTVSSSTTTLKPTPTTTTSAACVTWSPANVNYHSFGGSRTDSTCFGVTLCLSCCALMDNCVGVDVNMHDNPPTCYVYTSMAAFSYGVGIDGIDQYSVLGRGICTSSSSTTTTTTPTTTSTTTITSTTTTTTTTTHTTTTTTTTPSTTSTSTPDTSTSTSTTMSTTSYKNTPLSSSSRARASSTTTTTTPTTTTPAICLPTWSPVLQNKHSFGGTRTTPDCFGDANCLACCADNDDCVGVDIDENYNPAVCYTYTSALLMSYVESANGVNQYVVITRTCPTTSTTVTSTSTTTMTSPSSTPPVKAKEVIAVVACKAGDWVCDGGRCLSAASRCNGVYDCSDLSDEFNCNSAVCQQSDGAISCSNGQCILPYQWCDGVVDCTDYSDEMSCPCTSAKSFKCLNGLCISLTLTCDGIPDCSNGEDEFNCSCSGSQYQCRGAACIPNSMVCDGKQDCPNADDEAPMTSGCRTCSAGQFQCTSDYSCISGVFRCDGSANCPDGSDEVGCVQYVASGSERKKRDAGYYNEMYPQSPHLLSLLYKSTTLKYYVCFDGWTADWSDASCRQLGYPSSLYTIDSAPVDSSPLLVVNAATIARSSGNILPFMSSQKSCKSNRIVAINCLLPTCGLRVVSENQDVSFVGSGRVSLPNSWPWTALIYSDGAYRCPATIIADRWVITSARCIMSTSTGQPLGLSTLYVLAGTVFLATPTATLQNSTVSQVFVSTSFESSSWIGDVAVIRLSTPFRFSSSVFPVCLPPSVSPSAAAAVNFKKYTVCAVTGWTPARSSISNAIKLENQMRQVRVVPLTSGQCQQLVATADNSLLCINSTLVYSNSTIGAGSGVVCRDSTNAWTLVGIALQSFGINPFTNVFYYSSWINSVMAQNS